MPFERASFVADVLAGGMKFLQPAKWVALTAHLKGQRVLVTVEKEYQRRSSAANRRYWGVIVPTVAEYLSLGRELPLSKDQAHILLKQAFLGVEETELGPVAKSTTKLSTEQFYEYTEQITAHFAQKGVVFPSQESLYA